jgi:glycine/D-amino acid oxidase-like deaminating enzyme
MKRGHPMKNHEMTPTEASFSLQICQATDFPKLESGLEVEVVVLGRGIAGITTATLLKDTGHTVAVPEADRIVKDVTVGTTAKISAAPYLVYGSLLSRFGKAIAQKTALANMNAVEKIADIVRERKTRKHR